MRERVHFKSSFHKDLELKWGPFILIRLKYKGNGHNVGEKFVLVITFCQTHIFRNRFGCWSAFWLYFEKTSLKTIFMAISELGHKGHYGYFPLLVIMAGLNMAINMVFMGVFSNYSQNADQQPKRFLKICVWQKGMTKTNFSPKLWPFPLYFRLIFQWVCGNPKYARIFMKFLLVFTLI